MRSAAYSGLAFSAGLAVALLTGMAGGASLLPPPDAPVEPRPLSALPSPQLAAFRDVVAGASEFGLPPREVTRLHRRLWVESRYRADAVNPTSGAAGVAQFMPRTWAYARAGAGLPEGASPMDRPDAIRAACWLWSQPGGPRHWGVAP